MLATIAVTVRVKGPVLTRGTAAGAFGIDAPIARLDDDRAYLPGTHILGKALHALADCRLAEADFDRELRVREAPILLECLHDGFVDVVDDDGGSSLGRSLVPAGRTGHTESLTARPA